MRELAELTDISASLGSDEMLVQAGGGNTSVKTESGLWVKASGAKLADARNSDIFVSLPWSRVDEWKMGSEEALVVQDARGKSVRASVETAMHLALPHRFVAHVHSVRAISWLVQPDRANELQQRLSGLRWTRLPYTHPGRTLAEEIRRSIEGQSLDVVLLDNHGLVTGATDSSQLLALIHNIEDRLESPIRTPQAGSETPASENGIQGWVPVDGFPPHLAFDPEALEVASGGTLYPDHCVYLGPGIATAESRRCVPEGLERYEKRFGIAARGLWVRNLGAFLRPDAESAAHEMMRCLANVVNRIRAGARVMYLQQEEVKTLMNWDAEAYRLQVAAEANTPNPN